MAQYCVVHFVRIVPDMLYERRARESSQRRRGICSRRESFGERAQAQFVIVVRRAVRRERRDETRSCVYRC